MDLISQIKNHEGLRLKPYRDTRGFLTIGYGRCIDKRGITLEEANFLLQNDIDECKSNLEHFQWYKIQPPEVKDALVNMCFNLGLRGLLGFKNMIAALGRGDYAEAAKHALDSSWSVQVKGRANEIAQVFINAGK